MPSKLLLDLGDEPKRPKKHVIKSTCSTCGLVPGCNMMRPLTAEQHVSFLDLGYDVLDNALGDPIVSAPKDNGHYRCAHHVWCKIGHPKPTRPTWHQVLRREQY